MIVRTPVPVLAVGLCVLLAACTTGTSGPGPVTTVTVDAPPSSSGAPSSGLPSGANSASPSGPTTKLVTKLPGTCRGLLPQSEVVNALGSSLSGDTEFVVGTPEKDIGRLGYINCRYGVPSGTDNPAVEIGVSLYRNAALATKRINATVTAYQDNGADSATTTVSGVPANTLIGGNGSDYDVPTIVLAVGQRTVAVSVTDDAAGSDVTKALSAVGALTLKRTGG